MDTLLFINIGRIIIWLGLSGQSAFKISMAKVGVNFHTPLQHFLILFWASVDLCHLTLPQLRPHLSMHDTAHASPTTFPLILFVPTQRFTEPIIPAPCIWNVGGVRWARCTIILGVADYSSHVQAGWVWVLAVYSCGGSRGRLQGRMRKREIGVAFADHAFESRDFAF